jgi:hypothetical protein
MRLAEVYSPKRAVEFENMPSQNIENQPLLEITAKGKAEAKVELVPRLCLGTDIERLCLAWLSSEAEPLNGHSQAELGNE